MTIEPHNAYKIKDKNLPFKDKGYKQSWIRFFNTKEIQNVLVDASLFLLIYEVLKSIIIGRIRNLYETGWEMDGTIWIDNEYKEKVAEKLIDGNRSIFKASLLWLEKNKAIDMNDVKHIYELKELRDMIAHEAVNLILEGEPQIDFNQKIELCTQYIRKIENWWIINFELPIDMESDPTKSPNEESVLSGNEILAKYVVNLADDIKKAIK